MKFIFDLDGTLTKQETLPLIAKHFNLEKEINELTSQTIKGNVPFIESFIRRAHILSSVPVSKISELLTAVDLSEEILEFIHQNKKDCLIATGNLIGWIDGLVRRVPCETIGSQGEIINDHLVKLTNILRKEDLVKTLQDNGEEVTFIGDGNNDVEAMRLANVSIACGIVHQPAPTVLAVVDYVVYSPKALCRLLNQIKSPQPGKSVVVSCAGIGSRLGLGQTKALIKIFDKPIIHWQIEFFESVGGVSDLRVVVGYQSSELIDSVLKKTNDVIFVYNHDYFRTKTGASLYLGALHANSLIIAWDGDLVVHPEDIKRCLQTDSEYIAGSERFSGGDIFLKTNSNNEVTSFSTERTHFEWTGPACIEKAKIGYTSENVFDQLQNYLPLPFLGIRARDVDSYIDYKYIINFMSDFLSLNGGKNDDALKFYTGLASRITNQRETRNKSEDFSAFDVSLMARFACRSKVLLDLGSGTGLLVNKLNGMFKKITAVEKYPQFSQYILKSDFIEVVNDDIRDFRIPIGCEYDVISLFGVMNFFNDFEAQSIYERLWSWVRPEGVVVVKNQMGVAADVTINGFSEELNDFYFSHYRWLRKELDMLTDVGFKKIDVIDIYPTEYNRWENTHFYALVCSK